VSVDRDRFARVKAAFDAARDLDCAARAAYLDAAFADDAESRRRVQAMLDADVSSFLDTPAPVVLGLDAAPDEDVVGRTIGVYTIESRIGAGAMGAVYRARDARLDRPVALKFLPARLAADAEHLRRFHTEARAVSALNHPHILVVHDVGDADGRPFLVTEYVEGRTLRARLSEGPLAPRDALAIATQMASALAAAHARGIVHRDVKPENVMIRPDGYVKVLDFGIAKLAESAHVDGAVIGTPQYMSPEQARGLIVDARSDVWSLGVVLKEMFAGAPPPAGVGAIVARALRRDPVKRYSSARELQAALAAVAASPTAARPAIGRWAAGFGAVLLAAAVAWWIRPSARPRGPEPIRALAVLPLRNLSGNGGDDYFAEGLSDELTTTLARISSLRVISSASTRRYRGAAIPLTQIAHELGVDAIVEGSVTRIGSRVRITAQLLDGRMDGHLWAQSYERDLDEIVDVQDAVARDIAQQVSATLRPEARASAVRRGVRPDAYEAYLRGRHELGRQTEESFKQAIRDFEQSIDRDPLYAPAYSGLADAYNLMANYQFLAPREAFPRAEQAAAKALAFDPQLSEAHASLGLAHHHYDWDWAAAAADYRRAIDLDPSNALARLRYAEYLTTLGDTDAALREVRQAVELDPLSIVVRANVGRVLFYGRQYDEAIARFRPIVEEDANRTYVWGFLAASYSQSGHMPEALEALARRAAHLPDARDSTTAQTYAWAGRHADARAILEFLAGTPEASHEWYFISAVYAALGDQQTAFAWLDRALERHDYFLAFAQVDPYMDPLRGDDRFARLLSTIHYPRH
jgi:TolB-like protein/Tfp pilus assembly protein PilF